MDLLRRRLIYRSAYRGCKESEIILQRFIEGEFNVMSEKTLQMFSELLDCDDLDLLDWLKRVTTPPERFGTIIDQIRRYI